MCFLEQSLDMSSTINSRNHNSHLLQRIQEIEKLKNQCDILIQDIKCKNDLIIKQQDEIKALKEAPQYKFCPNCGTKRNRCLSPDRRFKSLDPTLQNIEVKVSLSTKKLKSKQKKMEDMFVKSELVKQLDRDVQQMNQIFQKIDHLLIKDQMEYQSQDPSGCESGPQNSKSPMAPPANIKSSIVPTKQINLD